MYNNEKESIMKTHELIDPTEVSSGAEENQPIGLSQPAVILLIREYEFWGQQVDMTVYLNGDTIGTMDNKAFLLCKTHQVNNIISLNGLCEFNVQAGNGEKIQWRFNSCLSLVERC